MKPSRLLFTGAAALLLSACYTAPIRPPALDDARIAVESARANPQVASYAPTELHDAVATYERAWRGEAMTTAIRERRCSARTKSRVRGASDEFLDLSQPQN